MHIKIRLYKMHDYDLCKLYITKGFNFSFLMKQAVRAYVRGEQYSICTPPTINPKLPPSKIEMKITFDDIKDADIIDFLMHIKKRQKNSFFKSLFRQCLDKNILSNYLCDDYNGNRPFFSITEKKYEKEEDKKPLKKKEIKIKKEDNKSKKENVKEFENNIIEKEPENTDIMDDSLEVMDALENMIKLF